MLIGEFLFSVQRSIKYSLNKYDICMRYTYTIKMIADRLIF